MEHVGEEINVVKIEESGESDLSLRQDGVKESIEDGDECFAIERCNSCDHLAIYTSKEKKMEIPKNNAETKCFNDRNVEGVEEILKIDKPFKARNCFLKGCKWSPDGLCLLSNSEDNVLRLFEITKDTEIKNSDISPVLVAKEGGIIYDFVWYPKMSSLNPVTCVFASTSHCSPIHLWDAYTGMLRATYQPVNQYDEVAAAYSIAFSPDGTKLYSGSRKSVRVFDITQPGRVSHERKLRINKCKIFQSNITSSICVNPVMSNIYALGSYDKTVGIYTEPDGLLQCLFKGQNGGVTQVMFSKDGLQLYAGGRKDSEILCWDLRNLGKVLFVLNRKVDTNQRIYYDLNSDGFLATGSTDGNITIYDVKDRNVEFNTSLEPVIKWKGHNDCVNGVSFHPSHPVIASSSGQYHLPRLSTYEDNDDEIDEAVTVENSIKLWLVKFC